MSGIKALIPAIVAAAFFSLGQAETDSPRYDISMKHEIEQCFGRALSYLSQTQQEDGSWSDYPGITALVLTAYLAAPDQLGARYNETIVGGFRYLIDHIKEDGGIYPPYEPQLKAYNTSVAIMAMMAAKTPAFEEHILEARHYLMSLQADEDDGLTEDSATYGGIGYNKDERSDISNMQFALEAIKASESLEWLSDRTAAPADPDSSDNQLNAIDEELFWDRAILFLQRCQNFQKYNDFKWSSNDGGFVYYPGVSKAGGTTSYGGMTYAGMKSLIHAGLDKDDERVQAAFGWIRGNYTVDTNPELGQQGLFYYYHVMAKALAACGDSILVDTSGTAHDWRGDLADKLISIQNPDGSWINENGRWWENNPNLATAYALLTLGQIIDF